MSKTMPKTMPKTMSKTMPKTAVIFIVSAILVMFLSGIGCKKSEAVGSVLGQNNEQTAADSGQSPEQITEGQSAEEQTAAGSGQSNGQSAEEQSPEQSAEEQESATANITQTTEQQQQDSEQNAEDSGQSDAGAVFNVEIIDLKFLPEEITVKAGTTVVWTNKDYFYGEMTKHMISSYDGAFRSGTLEWMDSYNYTFTEKDIGEHYYFDILFKERMKTQRGTVKVIP